jgi:hypothetical protein
MERSASKPKWRRRLRLFVFIFFGGVILWDSMAWALGEDIPILSQILVTELGHSTTFSEMLIQAQQTVKHVKEYTTLAKTVYGGIDEIRHMTAKELRDGALLGMRNAYPGAVDMYRDIKDIRNLNYRNQQAYDTLRGMLWENVYGPAIDVIHGSHDNLDAIAKSQELQQRETALLYAEQEILNAQAEDCEKGNGACLAASQRAEIEQGLLLKQIAEINLSALENQRQQRISETRKEVAQVQMYQQWLFDLRNHLARTTNSESTCPAGRCLYDRYGAKLNDEITHYKNLHPEQFRAQQGVINGY